MADVTLTAALRSNLLSLQGTQRLLDSTQLRLATGRKVNSPLDDPNAFFAAQSLTNRANDLSRLLDGIGQGVQTLKAADEGLKSLTSFLEQAQSTAQEALDQANGATTGADVTSSISINAANQADVTATLATNGETFTIQLGSGPTTTFTVSTGDSLADIVAEINGLEGLTATIVVDPANAANRFVRFQTTNGQNLTIGAGTGAGSDLFGAAVATTNATAGTPPDRASLEAAYDETLDQIDTLVGDAGYRGANLLNGSSLTVDFNEDGTASIDITGVDFTFGGLNIQDTTGLGFANATDIQTALDQIEDALTAVRAQARTFGTNLSIIQSREDFTQNLINTLKEGSDKLTLADKNEEGARLLALQTSQQLGITSLSLASQANQSVLRLFG
jgi:flagellin-like hook-associated protein FlgL